MISVQYSSNLTANSKVFAQMSFYYDANNCIQWRISYAECKSIESIVSIKSIDSWLKSMSHRLCVER